MLSKLFASFLMVEVVVSATAALVIIAKFGIDLCVFVAGYLDEIVPVHDRSYLVFEPVGLFDLLVRRGHDSFVLHFLTGAFSAVVEQR